MMTTRSPGPVRRAGWSGAPEGGFTSAGGRGAKPEGERLAQGWWLSLQVHERLRRLDEGRPLLELMRNEPGPA